MTEHPEHEDFERFVEGELDEPARGAFEAHVVSCAACAARLERAARLEVVMYELGAQLAGGAPIAHDSRRAARRRRIPPAVVAVAMLAAAVVLVVGLGDAPPPASRAIPQVVCPVPEDEAACVARARAHGLVVRFPASTPPPLGAGLGHGPSTSPFAEGGAW